MDSPPAAKVGSSCSSDEALIPWSPELPSGNPAAAAATALSMLPKRLRPPAAAFCAAIGTAGGAEAPASAASSGTVGKMGAVGAKVAVLAASC